MIFDNIIMQSMANDCGISCLLNIAQFYKKNTHKLEDVTRFIDLDNGISICKIIELGTLVGLKGQAFKIDIEQLEHIEKVLPIIVLNKRVEHYYIIYKIKKKIYTIDPLIGKITYTKDELIELSQSQYLYIILFNEG